MNIFNKNKNFLKAIALTILFTSSLNALDFKFINASFSKNVAKKTVIAGQSVCAANILSGSQAKFFNIKSLLGKLSSFATSKPKTFIALSAAALLLSGFFVCKFFIEKSFINSYKNYDVVKVKIGGFFSKCFIYRSESGYLISMLELISIDRAKKIINKHGNNIRYSYYWSHSYITLKMARLLVSLSGNINEANEYERTLLWYSCNNNKLEVVRELLRYKDIDVNKADEYGETPIHRACKAGNVEIVKELLSHKDIDVNKADKKGEIPLSIACETENIKIVKALLSHKNINVNQAYKDGKTLLFYFIYKAKNIEIIKELLKHKDVDFNKVYGEGNTLLHLVCTGAKEDYLKIAELLVALGADINKKNDHGHTPLYVGCINGHPDYEYLLLQNGAVIDQKSATEYKDQSYIQLVSKYNKPETNKFEFIFSKEQKKSEFNFLIRVTFGQLLKELNENSFASVDKIIKDSVFYKLYSFFIDKKNVTPGIFAELLYIFRNLKNKVYGQDDIYKFIEDAAKENGYYLKEKPFVEKRNFFNNLVKAKSSARFGDCRIITAE